MISGHIIIGKITTAHGIRGEVKVFPLTDDARRFLTLKKAYFCNEEQTELVPCEIKRARIDKDRVIVSFKDIDDRNTSETLRGKFICVDREDAVALPSDNYFIEDLKGLEVYDDTRGLLGAVGDVYTNASSSIVCVKREGKRDLLIPLAKEIFKNVDTAGGKMHCELPEGLYELYEV